MKAAETILKQMGGIGRIRAMTGAKQFLALAGQYVGVQFKFPNRLRSRGNYVRITLNVGDTYDMRFQNGAKVVAEFKGVYADQLKSLFEEQTGLRLSL